MQSTEPLEQNKIIQFPKQKIVREVPQEQQEAKEQRRTQKLADTIIDEISGLIITELDNYFVDVSDPLFKKDFVLVMDALKAAVYRQNDLEHPLQEFIDNNVRVVEGDLENMSKEEIQEKISELIKELQGVTKDLDEPEQQ